MLKSIKLTAVLATMTLGALASGVSAQEADPNIDVNGDGFYSFPELSTVMPDVTDEVFTALDTTGDGLLDMAEVMVGQEAGILAMPE